MIMIESLGERKTRERERNSSDFNVLSMRYQNVLKYHHGISKRERDEREMNEIVDFYVLTLVILLKHF